MGCFPLYLKRRKKAPGRNTYTKQPLKFNLVTLKFHFLEVSNIAIGSAVEGIISQSQANMQAGKQCPARRSKPKLSAW